MQSKELIFRQARENDLARILEIIFQAKAQMHALGSDQWQDGYPAPEHIEADIACGRGRVLTLPTGDRASEIVAYGAVAFDAEAAYTAIDGKWLTDGTYVVAHRLAVADGYKGRGIAGEFIRRTEAEARARGVAAFRIDTNFDNGYMLRLLERQGFVYCGKIRFERGERMAFEKIL